MTLKLTSEPAPLHLDPDNVVRVASTRVTLDTVIDAFKDGATAEQIVQEYPSLELGDVYAVIGYYLRRQDEVDRYLGGRRKDAERVRQEAGINSNLKGIRERLEARRSESGG